VDGGEQERSQTENINERERIGEKRDERCSGN